MQDYDELNHTKGLEIPSLHAIATSTATKHYNSPITAQELIYEQLRNLYCRSASPTVGLPRLMYNLDTNGFLVCTAPVHGSLEKVVPTSLQLHLLYHWHYPTLAVHPCEECMYNRMRRKLYWPHNGSNVYNPLRDRPKCAQNKPWNKHWRLVQLVPASDPLEFFAMDIMGPLLNIFSGNQYVLVMMDRYSELIIAVPTSKMTASNIESRFMSNRIRPNSILALVLTENRSQLVSKFYQWLCTFLRTKHLTTMSYHRKTNRLAERFKRGIIARLRQYVSEQQRPWDLFCTASHVRI